MRDLDCVIGDGAKVFSRVQKCGRPVPFILCSSEAPSSIAELRGQAIAAYVSKPFNLRSLLEALAKIPQLGAKDAPTAPKSSYCRVRISTLLRSGLLYGDLYLRLGEDRYVKVMKSGDAFDQGDAGRFQLKDLEFLYVRREDVEQFVSSYLKNLAPVTRAKEIPLEVEFQVATGTTEMIRELFQAFGWDGTVEKIVKENVALALKSMRHQEGLSGILSKLEKDPASYFASHSTTLAYVTCAIAQSLDWTSDFTFHKLTLASFLHDASLADGLLNKKEELEDKIKTDRFYRDDPDAAKYRTHPIDMAETVRKWAAVPPDVDSIILQHHETPHGEGFPYRVDSTRIQPLSALFIIAEDLVDQWYATGAAFNVHDFLESRAERYHGGHFKKVFQALLICLQAR